ncbi:hydroxysqualene dehydroxylase HpnE [Beijerinckia indica]|uniref:Squalene-associated FAD-dependent desaturase n=1 Tax=Beijerinckia indica subsp. indica (strain ATCC 9039 / DSM 1715 / NCIMB 8712) TaxID=395963 RepID=B2ICB9_BEII9|nr:hydroxysqualene dehydroxylase HpnE [Beijerinckia indica]ACB96716.1 squalene-associated FAD-dependent desaturase [Beijerinckia indica subsp. indica ATCC 9039]
MDRPIVHIVGAGLAGLAAAIALADGRREIILYEAARQAGGRCRSYFDTALGMVIDNGNHLLLSGNHEARRFLRTIGSEANLQGPTEADFPFFDLATGEHWRVRPNAGPLPWWVFSKNRRVPGTKPLDYLGLAKLLLTREDRKIGEILSDQGPLYQKLWRPFLLAALNLEPPEGSSALAASVIRETLAKGGQACRPMIAHPTLSAAFIEPALAWLSQRGAEICLDHRLRTIRFEGDRVAGLEFGDARMSLRPQDTLVLAVPAPVAQELVPGLQAPQRFTAIVNAHFKITPPAGFPPILGLVNSVSEWLFAFPERLAVTISGADHLLDEPREVLAAKIWAEVAKVTQIAAPLPAWQILKEKRATFAATPEENARRPGARTAFANLVLAGDWTATGLPATIEGAIRSGNFAARALLAN